MVECVSFLFYAEMMKNVITLYFYVGGAGAQAHIAIIAQAIQFKLKIFIS